MVLQRKIRFQFTLLLLLISAEAPAFSIAGNVSDYVFSSCTSFGDNDRNWNTLKAVVHSNTQTCKPDDQFLGNVGADVEEQLFHDLTKKQIEHQQCQRTKLQGLIQNLQKDPEFEDYINSKIKLQLANLRGTEYKLARLKMSLQAIKNDCSLAQALPFVSESTAQLYRNGALSVNYSCPAKRMSTETAESLVQQNFALGAQLAEAIQEMESQVAILKAQIPFAAAPKLQNLIERHTDEARSEAYNDQVASKNHVLDFETDVSMQAKLDNESFSKVEQSFPKKKALQALFQDYEERLEKSQSELENTKTKSGVYKLDDDQKRQIFKGPVGGEFVAQALMKAKPENTDDVKNMLCRLDAHYGVQRNKTDAYMDMGLGAATIALTALEMSTGVGAAPAVATGSAAFYRLKSAINVISNSKYVQYGVVAAAGTSAAVGVVQTVEKCKAPLAQVKECKPYSRDNVTSEMKLSACLTSAGMALIGAGGLTVASLRNTETGQDALEKLSKLHLGSASPQKFGSPEWRAQLEQFAAQSGRNIQGSAELNKKLIEVPEYKALTNSIYEKGDISGIARLSKEQQVEFLTAFHYHNRTRISTAEMNLQKPNLSQSERAQFKSELVQAKRNKEILSDVLRNVTRREVSHQLTAQAKFSVEMVQKFEKVLRAGGAGRNVTKDED